jgi:hypothetical protein
MSNCQSCGASFFWAIHERTGRPAPVNADPTADGNIAIRFETAHNGIQAVYRVLGKSENYDGARYTNHWMDCPDREEWRRQLAEGRPSKGARRG